MEIYHVLNKEFQWKVTATAKSKGQPFFLQEHLEGMVTVIFILLGQPKENI
jgi:hypothetical protein